MKKDVIIFIHGLGRTKNSMSKAQKYFSDLGYLTENINYPSRRLEVAEITENFLAPIIQKYKNLDSVNKIHIVSHSMGGIITRYYLQNNSLPNGSRIVMLAPPNKGSKIIDSFKKNSVIETLMNNILGPAGMSLSTDNNSIPNTINDNLQNEIGVIIGKFDGKVSKESAKLKGMKDYLVVNRTHSFLMERKSVLVQIENFLKLGYFVKS